MHLRPSEMKLETNGLEMKPLPAGKSAEQVMADFLHYLFEETGKYIVDHQSDGPNLWPEVRDRAQFVLAHPNGWTGPSQQKMRRAAVMAGLVPDNGESYKRITFVTEGEASALACLSGGLGPERLEVLSESYYFEIVTQKCLLAWIPFHGLGRWRRYTRCG